MTDKVTKTLEALGLRPDDVDPDVLAGLRRAATAGPKQMTREQLTGLSPEAINKARVEGRLETVLGRR
jgi:hypothetical protein